MKFIRLPRKEIKREWGGEEKDARADRRKHRRRENKRKEELPLQLYRVSPKKSFFFRLAFILSAMVGSGCASRIL